MTDTWTQQDVREFFDRVSDEIRDWQGLPVMLGAEQPLVLAEGHPLRDLYRSLHQADMVNVEFIVDEQFEHHCGVDDVRDDERIVNEWFCRKRNCRVFVVHRAGRYFALTQPVSPDRSMDRLTMWLQTIGAADAWDLEAEHRARATLRDMLTERQWMHYDLTGSFFETSPRSNVTYLLRRLRPTVAMTPRWKNPSIDSMRVLAVLCLHPIGYYDRTWAGCMVPSDDVIAHLAWLRGDEAGFWKHANQHAPSSPEAGL